MRGHVITIVDTKPDVTRYDVEIRFEPKQGNVTNVQGATNEDLQQLADLLAARGIRPAGEVA